MIALQEGLSLDDCTMVKQPRLRELDVAFGMNEVEIVEDQWRFRDERELLL